MGGDIVVNADVALHCLGGTSLTENRLDLKLLSNDLLKSLKPEKIA